MPVLLDDMNQHPVVSPKDVFDKKLTGSATHKGFFSPKRYKRQDFNWEKTKLLFINAEHKHITFGAELAPTLAGTTPNSFPNGRDYRHLKTQNPFTLKLRYNSYGLNQILDPNVNPEIAHSWQLLHEDDDHRFYMGLYLSEGIYYEDIFDQDNQDFVPDVFLLTLILPKQAQEDTPIDYVDLEEDVDLKSQRGQLKIHQEYTDCDFNTKPNGAFEHLNEMIPNQYDNGLTNKLKQDIIDHYSQLDIQKVLQAQANTYEYKRREIVQEQTLAILDQLKQNQAQLIKQQEFLLFEFLNELISYVIRFDTDGGKQLDGDFFLDLYNRLTAFDFDTTDFINLISKSLRLSLAHKLITVQQTVDDGLIQPIQWSDPNSQVISQGDYNADQERLINATEPLIIAQAGAGCGKSHTLVGRLKRLQEEGVNLNQVLVLNFTNVASDEIKHRFPQIHSVTLANMINHIYSNSFPSQELSQSTTIANTLRTINPDAINIKNYNKNDIEKIITSLAYYLEQSQAQYQAKLSVQEVYEQLTDLVRQHLNLVEIILDAVQMTSLELEPVIIQQHFMQNTDRLSIPAKYQNINDIFVDEAQDISTFEYILLLELVIHYESRLFIIGDAGQTLYQFRNANPKFLNALESSHIFATYTLDTNYRSKQEILDVANQLAHGIEAYKANRLQLYANQITQTSKASIERAVSVKQEVINGYPSAKNYQNAIMERLDGQHPAVQYVINNIQQGRQVALLGWSRAEVQKALKIIRPIIEKALGRKIQHKSFIKERNFQTDLLSKVVSLLPKDVQELNVKPNEQDFHKRLKKAGHDWIQRLYAKRKYSPSWRYDLYDNNLDKVWESPLVKSAMMQYSSQQTPSAADRVYSEVKRGLIDRENEINNVNNKLNTVDDKNIENADLITSTIHGVKGREFDNVLLLVNNSAIRAVSSDKLQENLRMLNVALTRAIDSEYLLNFVSSRDAKREIETSLYGLFTNPIESAVASALEKADNRRNS